VKRCLPLLPLLLMIACATQTSSLSLTEAILTLTATAWTPTVSPTPIPNTAILVEALNRNLVGRDPLAETVDAKFFVTDLQFAPDEKNNLTTLRVRVECECVYSSCCSNERTFVQLVHAFAANERTVREVTQQLPATIRLLQVIALEHMQEKGIIEVAWSDLLLYAGGQINGNQLGSRIVRVGQ
jgi:hypothetical protein